MKLFTNRLTIGRSMGAVIAALLFPAAARSSINALYLHDSQIWTYSFTNIGLELTDLASWTILAYGLRTPDDPIQQVQKIDAKETRQQMTSLIRALWRKI